MKALDKISPFLMGVAMNFLKPAIKAFLKEQIKKQQDPIIAMIKQKVDIPKMTPEEEVALYTKIYDAVEESLDIVIERY